MQPRQYDSAILEICPYRMSGLPHIKDFVDKKAAQYTSLKVLYKYGAYPRLTLMGPMGKDTMRVDNWRGAAFEEFLRDRLLLAA